ncbi:MAG: hypothetical protein ACTHME_03410 [Candidatus Nitrosocosmicus sp.]
MSSSKKIPSKKRILVTILSITTSLFLLTAFLSMAPATFVNAIFQNQHNNIMGANFGGGGIGKPFHNGYLTNGLFNNNNIPQINGTINLKNSTGTISIKNVSVPFLTASQSAQSAISNGIIIGGHIGVTQGFLTYIFAVSNPANNTISNVIVDAGNGKVLYTLQGMSLNSTQFAMNGMNGGFGGHGGFGGYWGHDNWRHDNWGHDGNRGW